MKTISSWQPWASLMALGVKKIETRSWPLPKGFKGPLAIHASKKLVRVDEWTFYEALKDFNLTYDDLPLGFILCYFKSVACEQITKYNPPDFPECDFGDYTPGRFMWICEDLVVLPVPLQVRGHQRLWNCDLVALYDSI